MRQHSSSSPSPHKLNAYQVSDLTSSLEFFLSHSDGGPSLFWQDRINANRQHAFCDTRPSCRSVGDPRDPRLARSCTFICSRLCRGCPSIAAHVSQAAAQIALLARSLSSHFRPSVRSIEPSVRRSSRPRRGEGRRAWMAPGCLMAATAGHSADVVGPRSMVAMTDRENSRGGAAALV